jgi:hypothetical protein
MHDAVIAQNLAASAGFIVEGDEERYQPEKGAIGVKDLKAPSTAPSPMQAVQKIYAQKVVTADDFEAACIASGLPPEQTETDAISGLVLSGDYKGAVKMLIANMAEV